MIDPWAVIGKPPQHRDYRHMAGIAPEIAESALIEAYVSVDAGTQRATRVGERTWIMKAVHVGHDAIIGDDCEIAPNVGIGGWVELGNGVRIGMNASIKNRVKIGDGARVGMGAVVIRDVPPGVVVVGNPAAQLLQGRGLRQRQVEEATGEIHTELEDKGWEEFAEMAEKVRELGWPESVR